MIRSKKIDCLLIGDCFFDITVKLSDYKKALSIGGALETDSITMMPGGMGNIAVPITMLGGIVALCGVVDNDALGRVYREDLEQNSVLSMLLKKKTRSTGLLLALISSNAERSFLVARGANDYLKKSHVESAFEKFSPRVVFISGYSLNKKSMESILLNLIDLAHINNCKIVFDCTPFNLVHDKRDLFMHIISKSYCTCLNYQEASSLLDMTDLETIITTLRKTQCFFALKLGSQGCILVTKRGVKRISAKKVPVKDTTGAGDCFAAAIAFGISRSFAEQEMGELGVKLGTLKAHYAGPRLPTNIRYRKNEV